jgi:hypothetical protein
MTASCRGPTFRYFKIDCARLMMPWRERKPKLPSIKEALAQVAACRSHLIETQGGSGQTGLQSAPLAPRASWLSNYRKRHLGEISKCVALHFWDWLRVALTACAQMAAQQAIKSAVECNQAVRNSPEGQMVYARLWAFDDSDTAAKLSDPAPLSGLLKTVLIWRSSPT